MEEVGGRSFFGGSCAAGRTWKRRFADGSGGAAAFGSISATRARRRRIPCSFCRRERGGLYMEAVADSRQSRRAHTAPFFLRKGAAGRSPTAVRHLPSPTPPQGRVINIACCQICGHWLNLEWRSERERQDRLGKCRGFPWDVQVQGEACRNLTLPISPGKFSYMAFMELASIFPSVLDLARTHVFPGCFSARTSRFPSNFALSFCKS